MKAPRLHLLLAAALLRSPILLRSEVNEELAKKLFGQEISATELENTAEEALKQGAPKQIISEAKLVWGLRHQDDSYLQKVLPELEEAAKNFKKEDSAGMGSVEEFNGLLSYIRALGAMDKGDEDGFKKHITDAFWLSPDQGQLFAQTITKHRNEAKMANVKIDMKLAITTSKGEATTLGDQLGKNKAILLDFWASWCGPCMSLMPELRKKAQHLSKSGIAVCGMNTESDEAIADKVRGEKDMKMPWLVEPKSRPFSDLLDIKSIPRMVLIAPDGKILFNGHPQEPGLWAALKKVDGAIEMMKEE
jgi:thiol-disulfide isomerase/thioredoxin